MIHPKSESQRVHLCYPQISWVVLCMQRVITYRIKAIKLWVSWRRHSWAPRRPKSTRRWRFRWTWTRESWRKGLRWPWGRCRLRSWSPGWGSSVRCAAKSWASASGPLLRDELRVPWPCSPEPPRRPRGWSDGRGSFRFWPHRTKTPTSSAEYLLLRELAQRLVLVVSLDVVEDAGEGFAPVEDLARTDVAGAEDCGDFVGGDHFSILGGHLGAAEGDVEISQHQCQLAHLFFLSHVDKSYLITNNVGTKCVGLFRRWVELWLLYKRVYATLSL